MRSGPRYLVTCCWGGRQIITLRAGRADNAQDRPYPGGLSWLTRIPVQRPAIPRARRPRSRRPPGAGQHNRPVRHLAQQPRLRRTATRHRRPGRTRLRRWLAARSRARPGARRSSPERTAPATAGSRTVRTGTARQPGPPGTPRRSRVRTGHRSHSSPAAFRSAAGPRCPARCPVWIARHVPSAVPARPHRGHRAPPPGPELVRAAPVAVVVPQRTADGPAVLRDDGGHVMALFPA